MWREKKVKKKRTSKGTEERIKDGRVNRQRYESSRRMDRHIQNSSQKKQKTNETKWNNKTEKRKEKQKQ